MQWRENSGRDRRKDEIAGKPPRMLGEERMNFLSMVSFELLFMYFIYLNIECLCI
jgi:hypothetical protein